ncbi:MAG: hypothetical protein K2Q12_05855 [Rickettsiales bacterium]|nr:hypothetical protein [Rickettsiales bacterium]
MKFLETCSFRAHIRLALLLASAATVGLTAIGLIGMGAQTLLKDTQDELAMSAKLLGDRSAAALAFDNKNFATTTLEVLLQNPAVEVACLFDAQGKLFTNYLKPEIKDHSAGCQPWRTEALKQQTSSRYEGGRIIVSQLIFMNEEGVSVDMVGTLIIVASPIRLQSFIYQQTITGLMVVAVAMLLAWLLSLALEKRISHPVMQLVEVAQRIHERKDYCLQSEPLLKNELGILLVAFKDLLRERDAAHAHLLERSMEVEHVYRLSKSRLKEAKRAFDKPLHSLRGCYAIFQGRVMGHTLHDGYLQFLDDVQNDMETHDMMLESALTLTELYETALKHNKASLSLVTVLQTCFKKVPPAQLQLQLPPQVVSQDPRLLVYSATFEKMLEMFVGYYQLCREQQPLPLFLEAEILQTPSRLCLRLLIRVQSKSPRSDNLEQLIRQVKKGDLDFSAAGNDPYEPQQGNLILEQMGSEAEEYKFLIDSMSYLGASNKIIVSSDVQLCALEATLDLSSCLQRNDQLVKL